ncbi:MAG: C4-dicarboxylate TRAP transporter substrate-binding protein [Planctomycetaceae bacterium]|nr:C4-dicarboxylate TRAP transporter substrate-binding protein [Planctomycetaceae bacterium]
MRSTITKYVTAIVLCGAVAFACTPAYAVEMQIGYENHPGEPIDLACREWKRLIEERSNGEITVELYPSSQLGSKNDLMDQMVAGDSVVTLCDGSFYSDRGAPDFNIVYAPYLFDTWDDCWKLTKSDWWKEQADKLEKNGIKLLTVNWIYGERHTLTTKPVRNVADIRGMKIRVPNNLMQIASFEVIGASPTPLPLGDVYTALQQGVIDGLENPLPVLYNGKFHEVAKYLTLDGHVRNTTTWICGTLFFDSLSPEHQRILMETGDVAGLYNNKLTLDAAEEVLEQFEKEGVEIIRVDTNEFREASQGLYDYPALKAKWSPGLYERIQKAIE